MSVVLDLLKVDFVVLRYFCQWDINLDFSEIPLTLTNFEDFSFCHDLKTKTKITVTFLVSVFEFRAAAPTIVKKAHITTKR